jgi:HPt (histidine-containing phosphotransfer) domain-containing protein
MINHGMLEAIAAGSKSQLSSVLAAFRRSNGDDLARLLESLAAADFAQITRHSHRIRGAAAMLGARELELAGQRVEACSRGADMAGVREAMVELQAQVRQLDDYLVRMETAGPNMAQAGMPKGDSSALQ